MQHVQESRDEKYACLRDWNDISVDNEKTGLTAGVTVFMLCML